MPAIALAPIGACRAYLRGSAVCLPAGTALLLTATAPTVVAAGSSTVLIPRSTHVLLDISIEDDRCWLGTTAPDVLRVGATRSEAKSALAVRDSIDPVARDLLGHLAAHRPRAQDGRRALELLDRLLIQAPTATLGASLATPDRFDALLDWLWLDPGSDHSTQAAAELLGISRRSLTRLCREQMGMSYAAVRTAAHLQRSLLALAQGASVRRASQVAGFGSAEAYTTAFRRATGFVPSSFLQ